MNKKHETGNTEFEVTRIELQKKKEEGTKMKKFGFATIIASGMTAAFLGLAAPASAGVDHLDWLNDIHQQVAVPHVDTGVQHSR